MTFLCLLLLLHASTDIYILYNHARLITSSTGKRLEAMALAIFKVGSYRYAHSRSWYAINYGGKGLELM